MAPLIERTLNDIELEYRVWVRMFGRDKADELRDEVEARRTDHIGSEIGPQSCEVSETDER